jgi:HlyD family type I secretion membrane fusion protein
MDGNTVPAPTPHGSPELGESIAAAAFLILQVITATLGAAVDVVVAHPLPTLISAAAVLLALWLLFRRRGSDTHSAPIQAQHARPLYVIGAVVTLTVLAAAGAAVAFTPIRIEDASRAWAATADAMSSSVGWAAEFFTSQRIRLQRSIGETGLRWLEIGLVAAAFAGASILILRPRRSADTPSSSLASSVRNPSRLGWTTILVVFGLGGTLAAAVPLAGAAVAPGFVSPDGNRKTVQHLEGGIVQGIHVREGDIVQSGAQLITLEDTQARANMAEVRERLVHFLALESRLFAEQTGADRVTSPPATPLIDAAALAHSVRGQQDLFVSRRDTRAGRERILGQRILQLREESDGLREVIRSQDDQIALIRREIVTVQDMVNRGLERVPRLLALQRSQAELTGARASNFARIAKNKQAVGETEMELLTMRQQEREKVNEEMSTVRAELATLRSKLPARTDILDRTVVLAPIGGTVMNVRVTTVAGVVRPGEPLLEIVPQNAALIVDARVKPIDVDVVRPGMAAKVVFSAFAQRNLPQIQGRLRSISADRMTDERTGESYFIAKVEVDTRELEAVGPALQVVSGMPAEVFILTGERTALDYLVRPFLESITKSFRET